jgi:cysteine desulfurase
VATPIYLDHHATTPVHPRVLEAMAPLWANDFGNPASRSHAWGRRAAAAVEAARIAVAERVGADAREVVFTSGATEADNLAILGALRAGSKRHVVTVATEHRAVLDPVEAHVRDGGSATLLPVGADGLLDPDDVRRAIRADTALVSVMAVNNEIGVRQPLVAIGAVCREAGVPLHVDAAQAGAFEDIDRNAWGADLVSLSAHKMYGPKGVGALIARRGRGRPVLAPLMFGGGHERGLRPGTLPTPLIAGMGEACKLAREGLGEGLPGRVGALRDRLLAGLREHVDDLVVHGSVDARAVHNLHVGIPGVESEALLLGLRDIALSTGSACSSADLRPSHVLAAIGALREGPYATIRFGLGRDTTAEEVHDVVQRLGDAVARLRRLHTDWR